MGTFLIIAVIAIILFFFMRGIFSFKHSIQLSIKPFNEWMILAKSSNGKELESMCHGVLLETATLLESINMISNRDFRKLYSDSKIYASNLVMLTLITIDIKESISKSEGFKLSELDEVRVYLQKCFCIIYFDGFTINNTTYRGLEAFYALSKYSYGKEQESWK